MNTSLWSRKVRERDRTCRLRLVGCGVVAHEAHHIFGRSLKKLATDTDNGIGLCSSCHTWVEAHPVEAVNLILYRRMDRATRERLVEKVRDSYPYALAGLQEDGKAS